MSKKQIKVKNQLMMVKQKIHNFIVRFINLS